VFWIEVPFSSLPDSGDEIEDRATISGVSGCLHEPCAMGFPSNDIRVVANKDIIRSYPDVKHLLERVQIPLDDILAQNAKMLEGEDEIEDIRRHARDWIRVNLISDPIAKGDKS
jgi:glycine betaine/proline transport system substrate-binding protein